MRLLILLKMIFRQFPFMVLSNVIIIMFVGLLDALSVVSLAPVVDLLIKQDVQNTSSITKYTIKLLGQIGISANIGTILFIFLLLNIFRSAISILSALFIYRIKYSFLNNLIMSAAQDFFRARWYFFTSSNQANLLTLFFREINNIGDSFGSIAIMSAGILQCSLFLVVPFFVSWKVTSISIATAIIFALPLKLLEKSTYNFGKMSMLTWGKLAKIIQESFLSAKIILGFGNSEDTLASMQTSFNDYRKATIKSQLLTNSIPLMYFPTGIFVLVITIMCGNYFNVSLAGIAIILYTFLKVLPILGNIIQHKNLVNVFFPSYEMWMKIRQQAQALVQKTGIKIFNGIRQEIAIKDASFSYDGCKSVVKDINVLIPKGKMIAFVGKSGSGKSTLIDMIMGFNEPQEGQVLIDDIPLSEFDINSYRQCIGYVPQDSILFNLSIMDNLRWAKHASTDAEIYEACKIANATEFIEIMPDKYHTVVGDRGVRLSGGQIQRIALARAILRSPDVLILDEATSSLDAESEKLIQQSIETIAKKTTVIVIAHRLSTIINSDYIYVMDNGSIVEEGNYTGLITKNEMFCKMAASQFLT